MKTSVQYKSIGYAGDRFLILKVQRTVWRAPEERAYERMQRKEKTVQ